MVGVGYAIAVWRALVCYAQTTRRLMLIIMKNAEKSLEEISRTIKLETDLENLISAKTNGECVVVINDGKAQVILNKNTLNDTISTQIIDIIASQANIFSENITLIETK